MESIETNIQFPKGFLIGAASSAHQVEGNNTHSDWWHYEKQGKVPVSGIATDHYHRFDEDFAIAEKIGLNAMRISIEWARIETEEGKWNMVEIEHYRSVLQSMKQHGLTRMVTLQHFTLPWWLAQRGGFKAMDAPKLFARYAAFVVSQLDNEVELWCTINEPEVYVFMTHVRGAHPPFKKNSLAVPWLVRQLLVAHKQAYLAIKRIRPHAQVGMAKNNTYHEPYRKNNIFDQLATRLADYTGNYFLLNRMAKYADFIGLNYYFSHVLKFTMTRAYVNMSTTEPRSDMGWRTYPEGIYHLVVDIYRRYRKPIYITENGIANARDDMRQRYIYEHLLWLKKALKEGASVRGYFYWTLVDNYEWHDGFGPKFGLVELNNETLERRVRPSAEIFKKIKLA